MARDISRLGKKCRRCKEFTESRRLRLRATLDCFAAGFGEEDFGDQQDGSDNDGAVGDVKGRPVVTADVEVEEVDDMSVDDAVPEVAECAAQDER